MSEPKSGDRLVGGVAIDGVEIIALMDYVDERGQFTEFFRKEWFPETNWDIIQMNCSKSKSNVLRGMHYHFNQVDYWYVPKGMLLVGLADLRENSPTKGNVWNGFMSEDTPIGLFIPEGVVHGFYCVKDAELLYVVNNYFDGSDENGISWKDPMFESLWAPNFEPDVSERDDNAPFYDDILVLPEYKNERLFSEKIKNQLIAEGYINPNGVEPK